MDGEMKNEKAINYTDICTIIGSIKKLIHPERFTPGVFITDSLYEFFKLNQVIRKNDVVPVVYIKALIVSSSHLPEEGLRKVCDWKESNLIITVGFSIYGISP